MTVGVGLPGVMQFESNRASVGRTSPFSRAFFILSSASFADLKENNDFTWATQGLRAGSDYNLQQAGPETKCHIEPQYSTAPKHQNTPESSPTLLVHLGPGGNTINGHEEHFPGFYDAKEHLQVVENIGKNLLL